MRWLIPLALALVGLAFSSRQASAAVNYSPPHTPDPRDYFPVMSAPPGGYLQAEPQAPIDYADPYELWGAVNIFDAPLNPIPSPAYQPVIETTPESQPVIQPIQYIKAPMNPEANLKAFLSVIRQVEPNPPGSYTSLVGGGQFNDFSDHPARKGWPGVGGSTAAGAYQITLRTWREVLKRVPLPDFSPQSQDIAAVTILQFPWRQNAYSDVLAGNFDLALRKLSLEWEAFEKMLAGQYPVTLDSAKQLYAQNGGGFSDTVNV